MTIISLSNIISAQDQNTIDSLNAIIKNTKQDSVLIYTYLNIANQYSKNHLDSSQYYFDLALEKSLQTNFKKAIADAYMQKAVSLIYLAEYNMADSLLNKAITIYQRINQQKQVMLCYNDLSVISFYKGENYKALDYSSKALEIAEDNGLIRNKATILSNIALVYINLGDYERANEYNFSALKIFQDLNNRMQIARCKLSIGSLYLKLDENEKAFDYINEALKGFEEENDTKGQSICLTNIGTIYNNQKKYQDALHYFKRAVEIDQKNNDLDGISSNYKSIGRTYFELGNYYTAMEYFKKALKIDKETGDKNGIATGYYEISRIETKRGNYQTAKDYCLKSIDSFNKAGELDKKRSSVEQLAIIYKQLGNYKKAYQTYIDAVVLKDSLFNIEKAKKIAQLEEKYLKEKLEKENLILKYENVLQQKEISQQKKISNTYLVAFIIAIITVTIIFIQLRKKNIAYKFLVKKNMDLINKEDEIKTMKNKMEGALGVNISDDKKEEILKKMDKLFESEKIFTKHDLTIEKLAKRLSTNRSYLSKIINEEFNKNYSDFLNEYRIKEAMLMLSDPSKNRKYSIEAIAKDAGFKTVSSFNPAFKRITGVTPSVFKNNAGN